MIKYFIYLLLTLPVWVSAQNSMDAASNVIPPSPEAASLGKFVDMPVNTYNGLPAIDIPLYELKSYQLSLPISLSYHASGLKVEEIASSVGAGWALNAGGLVSRTIRGLNDEHEQGYFSTTKLNGIFEVAPFFDATNASGVDFDYILNSTDPNCNGTPTNPSDAYQNIFFASRGGLDLEPDLFFFQLPDGQSGKFVHERDKSMTLIPKQYAEISYTLDGNGDPFHTWEIVGRDGTHYYFDLFETTTTVNTCQMNQPDPHPETPQPALPDVNAPSTWRLTKMVSANGLDSIMFSYAYENLSYSQSLAVTEYDRISGNATPPPTSLCLSTTSVSELRLTTIEASNGYKVTLEASSARQDLQGGYVLDSVKIYFNNDLIKYFTLDHSYHGLGTYDQKYLQLDKVTEYNNQDQAQPSYDLTYHNGMFDFSRRSKNVDHWGYYNGENNNGLKSAPGMIYQGRYYVGSDREPDLVSCQQGSLWKIRNPLGGETLITYELHDFSNLPTAQQYPYTPGLEELAVIEFNITGDASIDYSDTKTFSLTENTDVVYVYVIPEIFGGGIPVSGNSGTLTKSGSSFQVDFTVTGAFNPQVETLSSGNYTLTAEFDPSEFSWPPEHPLAGREFYIRVLKVNDLDDLVANGNLKGGGLRVKEIKQQGINEITKTYVYETTGGQSSGRLMSVPTYAYEMRINNDTWIDEFAACIIDYNGDFLIRTSASNIPLGMSQGSHVGYDRVIEYHGTPTQNNGYVVYTYTNTPDVQTFGTYYPYVPNKSYAYKNGLLLSQETYTATGDLVARQTNSYNYTEHEEVGVGFKVAENKQTSCLGCERREFIYNYYKQPTERFRLTATENTTLDMNYQGYLTQRQTFSYNSFDQVEQITASTSEPNYWRVMEKDYHVVDHTREQEVREYFQIETGTPFQYDYEFIQAQRTTFNANILPIEIHVAETDQQTLASNDTATFSTLFQKRLTYHAYGPTGNLLSFSKEDDVETSLVWGYDHLYPTAQVIYATENDIAYTSFEYGPPDGNWSYSGTGSPTAVSDAATGNKVFTGTGTFTRSGLNTGKSYKVAFWARGPGNVAINGVSYSVGSTPWKYIEATVTSSTWVTVTLSGQTVDELRLHPVEAQMTTYTYDPLTGMTSSTDPNHLTITYTYDAFRRLEYIEDHEGNILNRNEYRYALDN